MMNFYKSITITSWLVLLTPWVLAEEEYLTGIVKPLNDIEMSFPVDGVLVKQNYKEGQRVKKGDVVLQLDHKLQALEVARKALIWHDKSAVKMLRENTFLMDEMLSRKTHLYKTQKSVSKAELDGYVMQRNKLNGDYQNLLEGEKREELEYKIASEVLSYYSLTSPFGGIVVEIVPDVGEWVRVGEKAVRLVNSSLCFVELDVSKETAALLRTGVNIQLEIEHESGSLRREGKATFVSVVADESSGLVRAKVQFNNSDGLVLPGVAATLILEEE